MAAAWSSMIAALRAHEARHEGIANTWETTLRTNLTGLSLTLPSRTTSAFTSARPERVERLARAAPGGPDGDRPLLRAARLLRRRGEESARTGGGGATGGELAASTTSSSSAASEVRRPAARHVPCRDRGCARGPRTREMGVR